MNKILELHLIVFEIFVVCFLIYEYIKTLITYLGLKLKEGVKDNRNKQINNAYTYRKMRHLVYWVKNENKAKTTQISNLFYAIL